ncbi:MAG: DUF3151 family protein [Streptosporangiales bacterium]|nr:DUF3151 family protein [Streptosporangiales bacterium]
MSHLHRDLLSSSIPPVYLPDDAEERAVLADATDPADAARQFPEYSLAWATLADRAYAAGDPVTSYAYARTGYHRGLDQLRRAGWRGQGPVPWEHEPNQGFLRALFALGRAAAAIGEDDEAQRCSSFLRESSPAAAAALEH